MVRRAAQGEGHEGRAAATAAQGRSEEDRRSADRGLAQEGGCRRQGRHRRLQEDVTLRARHLAPGPFALRRARACSRGAALLMLVSCPVPYFTRVQVTVLQKIAAVQPWRSMVSFVLTVRVPA